MARKWIGGTSHSQNRPTNSTAATTGCCSTRIASAARPTRAQPPQPCGAAGQQHRAGDAKRDQHRPDMVHRHMLQPVQEEHPLRQILIAGLGHPPDQRQPGPERRLPPERRPVRRAPARGRRADTTMPPAWSPDRSARKIRRGRSPASRPDSWSRQPTAALPARQSSTRAAQGPAAGRRERKATSSSWPAMPHPPSGVKGQKNAGHARHRDRAAGRGTAENPGLPMQCPGRHPASPRAAQGRASRGRQRFASNSNRLTVGSNPVCRRRFAAGPPKPTRIGWTNRAFAAISACATLSLHRPAVLPHRPQFSIRLTEPSHRISRMAS